MEVTSKNINKSTLIKIKGEVDALSAIKLDDAIKKLLVETNGNVLIDCKELKYISSAGLGVFMSHLKSLEENNNKLILFNLSQEVYSTFEILGLHHIMDIVSNEEEALKIG